uniref:Glomulin n=1 Tax=Cacopsylla melanoneura TaxID=428564 RepID=A0A8D8QCA0_9HEMI
MSTSAEDMKEEILSAINHVLAKQDERLLVPILARQDYTLLISNGLYEDLLKIVIDHIEAKVQEAKLFRRQFEFYENTLCDLIKVSLSEGAVLSLIEHGTENSNDVFLVILKPLTLLLDQVINKCTVIQWSFTMIEDKLTALTLENHKLEGEELKLLDLDNDVETVIEMYMEAIKFYSYVIDNHYEDDLKHCLISSLVTILGNPMTNADLDSKENALPSNIRGQAEKIMLLVCKLIVNPVKFYNCLSLNEDLKKCKNMSVDNFPLSLQKSLIFPLEEFPSCALANFFYLLFSEKIGSFPQVYSPVYLFVQNTSLSQHLIISYSYLSINKGLKLMESSLEWIEDQSLTANDLFQVKDLINIFETLVNLVIYNDMKSLRLLGVKVFLSLLNKPSKDVLYLILLRIESILSQHSGLKSEIINNVLIRNLIHYNNKKLYDLIYMYCKLEKGIETDVVENKESIISSLNLLKYVKLNKHFAEFSEKYFPTFEAKILKVLEEALKISKEHYEAFLQEVQSGIVDRNKPEMSVSLMNNQKLPSVDPKQQEECLKESLCAIDLIQWTLSSVV